MDEIGEKMAMWLFAQDSVMAKQLNHGKWKEWDDPKLPKDIKELYRDWAEQILSLETDTRRIAVVKKRKGDFILHGHRCVEEVKDAQ